MSHSALSVPKDEFRRQKRLAATLAAAPLAAWVRRTEVIAALVQERLSRHPQIQVRSALAAHPHLVRTVELALVDGPSSMVRREVAANPNLHPQTYRRVLEHARKGGGNNDFLLTNLVTHSTSLSDDQRDEIVMLPDAMAWGALCARGDTPEGVLRELAGRTRSTKVGAARNPRLPHDLAEALSAEDQYIRQVLAGNPSLSEQQLLHLAEDPEDWVARRVAFRKDLPGSVLSVLKARPERAVGAALILHADLPESELRRYAEADLKGYGEALAQAAALPMDLLEQVHAGGAGLNAQCWVSAHPRMTREMMEASLERGSGHLFSLSRNPNLPLDLQRKVAAAPDRNTHVQLAANPALRVDAEFPVPFLRQTHPDMVVRPLDVDPGTWEAMLEFWQGSLTSLMGAALSLGPDAP